MKISANKDPKEISINNDTLANYVESLKMYAKDTPTISHKLLKVINSLPDPASIKSHLGDQEGVVLQESVNWAWEQITKHKMIDELQITKAPEQMMGNYWILKNGIILEGINHITIIRNNIVLFSSLLGLNPMTIIGCMQDVNKCIKMAINNGAIRTFIDKNKKSYFQMNSEVYSTWGRKKVKKLDLSEKIIKVIDLKQDYKGWDSGITITI